MFNQILLTLTEISPYLLIAVLVLLLALIILVIVLIAKQSRLNRRLTLFTQGQDGISLEESLKRVMEDNKKVKDQLKNDVKEILSINENLVTAYRKIGVVKYNAFPGMAGKVSSCIALLNNENNGIVINSIHGQDGCYTYVKEIMNGKSINPLTKEDEEALKIAMQMEI